MSNSITLRSVIVAAWVSVISDGYGVPLPKSGMVTEAPFNAKELPSSRKMSVSWVKVVLAADAGAARAPRTPAASTMATGGAIQRMRRENVVMRGTLGVVRPLGNLV